MSRSMRNRLANLEARRGPRSPYDDEIRDLFLNSVLPADRDEAIRTLEAYREKIRPSVLVGVATGVRRSRLAGLLLDELRRGRRPDQELVDEMVEERRESYL